jgi:hypothetical protein
MFAAFLGRKVFAAFLARKVCAAVLALHIPFKKLEILED